MNLNAQRIPNSFAPLTFSCLSSMKTTSDGAAPILSKALRNAVAPGLQLPSSHDVRIPSKSFSHPDLLRNLTCGSEVLEKR